MLKTYIDNGRLEFDVEYGNSVSFYSGSKTKTMPKINPSIFNGQATSVSWQGALKKSSIKLTEYWCVNNENLVRKLSFDSVGDSELFDMVSRFVVYSPTPTPASIAEHSYPHNSVNLYYQYENVDKVTVPISTEENIVFEPGNSFVPKGFKEVFYIRDEAKTELGYRWIVHHRLIIDPDISELILRCCNPRFEGVVPFQQFLPKFIKKQFFRIREAKFPSFPFMAVGEYQLSAGDNAVIETQVSICDR